MRRSALVACLVAVSACSCGGGGGGGGGDAGADAGHPDGRADAGKDGGGGGNDAGPDAGQADSGGQAGVDFAVLEGAAVETLASGQSAGFSLVVHITGVTDQVGPGAGVTAQLGYGPRGGDPTGTAFTWVDAAWDSDADGLSPGDHANDRLKATLAPSDGLWDVAGRVQYHGATVYVDRDWASLGYDSAEAIALTVAPLSVGWCNLQAPPSSTFQAGRGSLTGYGQVFVAGVTEPAGKGAGVVAELGVGPASTDPRSASGWTFTPGTYNLDVANNDEYQATVSPVPGAYAYAWRFSVGSGAPVYCDLDGSDGTTGSFDPAKLGSLTVTPTAVDWGMVEGSQNRSGLTGSSAAFTALVYAQGITDQVGQGAGVTLALGYGAPGTDPAVASGWTWVPMTFKEDVDGLVPGDHANDRYEASLAPPDGSYDVAVRASLLGGPDVFLDLDYGTAGYQTSEAVHLTLGPAIPDACKIQFPSSASIGVGASATVYGRVLVSGVTDQVGQGANVDGELGVGPAGSDGSSSGAWTWAAAAYNADTDGGATDEYQASLSPPAGSYAYAYRFRWKAGPWLYCDLDGSGNGYQVAQQGALTVSVPAISFANTWAGSSIENAGAQVLVQGEVYAAGITDLVGQGAGITAAVAAGPRGSNPSTWSGWAAAAYFSDTAGGGSHSNDLYVAWLPVPAAGAYDVALRFTLGAQTWYADGAGSASYDPAQAIHLDSFAPGADIGYCNLQWPVSSTLAPNGTDTGYGRIYVAGLTDASSSPAAGISSQLVVGPAGSDPRSASGWSWMSGGPNTTTYDFSQANDEHQATLRAPGATGSYAYTFRFRLSGGWTYCDKDGAGTNAGLTFDPAQLGALTVQ
jgi:hypothetical protein